MFATSDVGFPRIVVANSYWPVGSQAAKRPVAIETPAGNARPTIPVPVIEFMFHLDRMCIASWTDALLAGQ
jgi:hypothetical protein